MAPEVHILPLRDGTNPVRMVDFGGGSLNDAIAYCSRVLGWTEVVLYMAKSPSGRGKRAEIGDLSEEDFRSGSVERNIIAPDGATVRRLVIGPVVVAVISGPEGEVLDMAVEAVRYRKDSPVKLVDEYWEDIEAVEEEEEEEEEGDEFEDEFEEFDDDEEFDDEEADDDEEFDDEEADDDGEAEDDDEEFEDEEAEEGDEEEK